jgi:hypothetical protein
MKKKIQVGTLTFNEHYVMSLKWHLYHQKKVAQRRYYYCAVLQFSLAVGEFKTDSSGSLRISEKI